MNIILTVLYYPVFLIGLSMYEITITSYVGETPGAGSALFYMFISLPLAYVCARWTVIKLTDWVIGRAEKAAQRGKWEQYADLLFRHRAQFGFEGQNKKGIANYPPKHPNTLAEWVVDNEDDLRQYKIEIHTTNDRSAKRKLIFRDQQRYDRAMQVAIAGAKAYLRGYMGGQMNAEQLDKQIRAQEAAQ